MSVQLTHTLPCHRNTELAGLRPRCAQINLEEVHARAMIKHKTAQIVDEIPVEGPILPH